MAYTRPEFLQGCAGRKALDLMLMLATFAMALHILWSMKPEEGVLSLDSVTLSTVNTSGSAPARYHFKFRDEDALPASPKLRKLWTSKAWKVKVSIFSEIFQDAMQKNLLKACDRALCIGAGLGQEVQALKEVGVLNSIGIDLIAASPLVMKGDMHRQPFKRDTFDFEFANVFDHALFTPMFAAEVELTLKPGGCIVIHLALINEQGEASRSCNTLPDVDSLIALFKNFEVVHVGDINAFGLNTEMILRKRLHGGLQASKGSQRVREKTNLPTSQQVPRTCYVSKALQKIIGDAEPILPGKPWTQELKPIKHLPHMIDISKHRRHVLVEVGARDSDLDAWFQREYPKQNHTFLTYVVDAHRAYADKLANGSHVKLVPYVACVKINGTLFDSHQLGISGEMGMGGRLHSRRLMSQKTTKVSSKLQEQECGLDFAELLKQIAAPDDFVVLKMDVEGREFELMARMFVTGAICLVDELMPQRVPWLRKAL